MHAADFDRGAILVSAWGLDQDNIDFYQVIRATPRTVLVRRIESRITEIIGPTRAVIVPMFHSFRGEEQRRRIIHDEEGSYVCMSSWERATLWEGAAQVSTRYA